MNWNAIAALGELVGAGAVVVSLLYVGRELKHSSTVARVQGIQSTNEKLFEWALLISSDADLAELMMRVEKTGCGPEDFTPREAARVAYVYHALLSLTHTLYERRSEGLISLQELDRWAAQNRGVMGTPYLCKLWPRLRPNFPEDYTAWLEGRYNLPKGPPDAA
ncbi:MAG TPA: hypothetical protein VJ997_13215 [Longimicrobiales bacterium]|nr:hypothetical protein [Longimicrobiales bacterium]